MKRAVILPVVSIIAFLGRLNAWEDHPDKEDHREQDSIYKDAQRETGLGDWEREVQIELWNLERNGEYRNENNDRQEKGTWGPPDRDH